MSTSIHFKLNGEEEQVEAGDRIIQAITTAARTMNGGSS